jgi:hypothetical protein
MAYFSLKRTLSHYLKQALFSQNDVDIGESTDFLDLTSSLSSISSRISQALPLFCQEISLKKVGWVSPVTYALVRPLASHKLSIDDQAAAWVRRLQQTQRQMASPEATEMQRLWSVVDIQIWSQGMIQLQVPAAGLGLWLQRLNAWGRGRLSGNADTPASKEKATGPGAIPGSPSDAWQIQYAYSRSCSLLRLAAQHQIIRLQAAQLRAPPWLRPSQTQADPYEMLALPMDGLALADASEAALMHALVDALDSWEEMARAPWDAAKERLGWKGAVALGQMFEQFYRTCPIRQLGLPDAGRAGLVRATQVALHRLVVGRWGLALAEAL